MHLRVTSAYHLSSLGSQSMLTCRIYLTCRLTQASGYVGGTVEKSGKSRPADFSSHLDPLHGDTEYKQ